MLEGGASPDNKARFGEAGSYETPLSRAVDNDHPDIVKLLIEFGANTSDQPRNLMLTALLGKKKQIVQHLLSAGIDPNEKVGSIDYKQPLLHWVVTEDDHDIVCIDALLKAGADPDTVDTEGVTMLGIVILLGKADIVNSLLQANADVNNAGSNLGTPLCLAAENNNATIARMLLEAGAKVDIRDSYGQTPLFIAVNQHSLSMVSLLLSAGADPNISRNNGATMLAVAAYNGDAEIVRQLLKYQADIKQLVVTKKPDSNITVKVRVIDYARLGGNEDTIKLLEQHIQFLSYHGNYGEVRFFDKELIRDKNEKQTDNIFNFC